MDHFVFAKRSSSDAEHRRAVVQIFVD